MRYIIFGLVTLMLIFSTPTYVKADTSSHSALLFQLQTLLVKLQEQLAVLPQAQPFASGTIVTTATAQPSCDTFTAKPTSIKEGGSVTLAWTTSNAKTISINQNVGSKPVDGSVVVKPGKTLTYTLTAKNTAGVSDTCTAKVTVTSDLAPICDSFTVTPSSVSSGATTTLTWATSHAATVSIDNSIGNVNVDGSKTLTPIKTLTYTLTASNGTGKSVSCKKSVTVKPLPLPTCDSFTASSSSITNGQSASLNWKTTNTSAASIDNAVGTVSADGSKSVKPASTTKYTLSASNADGAKVTCVTTVTVKPASPNLSFCANTYKTKSGTLCAIQPSKIDSRTKDITPATGQLGDNVYGFGYHVFAVPTNWSAAKGVWIHFTGSYGRPYDQNDKSYGNTQWLDELMGQGYAVLQIAYDNRFSVNGDLCGKSNPGHARNNCAGEVREISLSGKGTSPYRSTDQYNTIDYRLKTLVGYIEDMQEISLPDSISSSNIDWSKLNISGHSQGSNQAYYIAKQRSVAGLCILAGAYDTNDTVKPGTLDIADWFTTGSSVTPISKITALLTKTDDTYPSFYSGLIYAVGMPKSQIVIDDTDPYYAESGKLLDGHAGTIKDPSLKSARVEACF